MKRIFLLLCLLPLLNGCYAKHIELETPLNKEHITRPLNWAMVHVKKGRGTPFDFYKYYKTQLKQDIKTDLRLNEQKHTFVRPAIKTYKGFPLRFHQHLRKEDIHIFSTAEVDFKQMVLKGRNTFLNQAVEADKLYMKLRVTLSFWSTKTQEKIMSHHYEDSGIGPVNLKEKLKQDLVQRVNQRLLKQFQAHYKSS